MEATQVQTAQDKINQARAKLAEKFGEGARTGGKGTQRRKKKTVHHTQLNDDKKLKTIIKKFNVHPLSDITDVNMFKDDGTILHFKNPEGKFKIGIHHLFT